MKIVIKELRGFIGNKTKNDLDIKNVHATSVLIETSNNEHNWTPVKYLNALHHNRTRK